VLRSSLFVHIFTCYLDFPQELYAERGAQCNYPRTYHEARSPTEAHPWPSQGMGLPKTDTNATPLFLDPQNKQSLRLQRGAAQCVSVAPVVGDSQHIQSLPASEEGRLGTAAGTTGLPRTIDYQICISLTRRDTRLNKRQAQLTWFAQVEDFTGLNPLLFVRTANPAFVPPVHNSVSSAPDASGPQ
jgi:hypothetical protein